MKGFQQNLFSKTPLSEIKKKSIPIGKNIKLKSDTSKTNTYQPNLFNKLQNKIEQLEEKIIELEIKKEEEKEVELNPLQFFGRVKEKSEHLNDREELDKEIRKLPFKLDYEDIPFQTAQNAYNFRSFSPDRRAIQTQNDYVKYFINLYKELSPLAKTEESKEELIYQIERYKEAFLKRKKALLYRSSNIASSVITGGGNFPARKMQKRMDAEHNAEGEFYKFQDKVEKIIYRKLRGLNGDYDFISVGDKDAKEKLEKKLDNLLKERERNNEINKHFRKHKNYKNFPLTEIEKKILSSYKKTWNMEYIPSYVNSNLSQNISRLKDRILELKRIEEMKESSKDLEHNGIKLIYNEDIQRVQIQFPGKPDKDIIKELKSRGFKWSPRENSWQRLLNQQGMRIAKDLFIKFSGYTPEPEPEQPKEKQKGKTLNDYIQELGLTKEFYKKSNGVSFVKIYNSEGKIVLDTKAEPANVLKKLKEYEKNINIPYFNFEIGKPYYMIGEKTKSILPYRIIDIDRENNFITYKFLSGQQPEKKVRLYSEGKEYEYFKLKDEENKIVKSLNEYKENPYNHLENIKWEDRNIISDEDFKNMDYGKLVSDLYYYKLRNFGTWNPNYNDDELLKHLIDTDNNFYKKSGVETKEQKPILPQNDNIIKFIPGKIYYGIHIGDSDLKSYYRVISRTNKQVTVIALDGNGNDYKEPFKRGIEIYSNIERFYPNGKYSMALSISADRESERIYEYKKNALDELGLKEVGEAKTIDELWIEHHNKDINTYIKKPKLELVQEIDNEEPGFFSKAEIDRKYINKEHKPTYKLLPEDKKNIQILIANIKNILLRNGLANKANEFIKEVYSGNKEISTVLFIAKKYLNIKF